MTVDEIRRQYRESPDWLIVGLITRIDKLEDEVAQLKAKPKRGRPPKQKVETDGVI